MAYILQKDIYYCYLDDKHTVRKTQNINFATKFNTKANAYSMLNRASRKLKNYNVVNLETMQQIEDVHKNKRKQFSQAERVKIYNNSKGRCAICGKFIPYDSFTVDHIIPLAKGGTNEMSNLQVACNTCNLIKQDILPEDLMKKLTEIIFYQMKNHYDVEFCRKINHIRKLEQKKRILKMVKIISRKWSKV